MTMEPDWTYHASRFIFSSFLKIIFLFVPCGGLSWLYVGFLLHVKYGAVVTYLLTVSYLIVSYQSNPISDSNLLHKLIVLMYCY